MSAFGYFFIGTHGNKIQHIRTKGIGVARVLVLAQKVLAPGVARGHRCFHTTRDYLKSSVIQ